MINCRRAMQDSSAGRRLNPSDTKSLASGTGGRITDAISAKTHSPRNAADNARRGRDEFRRARGICWRTGSTRRVAVFRDFDANARDDQRRG
jgi:hypothetical protein